MATATKDGRPMWVLRERETDGFIVWPADEGLHADIMKELNLMDDAVENMVQIRSYDDLKKLVGWVCG